MVKVVKGLDKHFSLNNPWLYKYLIFRVVGQEFYSIVRADNNHILLQSHPSQETLKSNISKRFPHQYVQWHNRICHHPDLNDTRSYIRTNLSFYQSQNLCTLLIHLLGMNLVLLLQSHRKMCCLNLQQRNIRYHRPKSQLFQKLLEFWYANFTFTDKCPKNDIPQSSQSWVMTSIIWIRLANTLLRHIKTIKPKYHLLEDIFINFIYAYKCLIRVFDFCWLRL